MSRWSVGAERPTSPPLGSLGPLGSTRRGPALCFALGLILGAPACSDEGQPRCVTVDATCTPRYQPTFANLYNNTLRDSCGSQSVACHSAAGRKGGLSMESADVAFAQLTAAGTGRVVAGDPACSEVVVRVHGTGESYLMPPGAPLLPADRCALEQWIAAGALFAPTSSGAASP